MEPEDLTVTYRNISDESLPQRDLTVKHYKRFDFFIGKHGPFIERFERETFTDAQLADRVRALQTTIRTLPR